MAEIIAWGLTAGVIFVLGGICFVGAHVAVGLLLDLQWRGRSLTARALAEWGIGSLALLGVLHVAVRLLEGLA